MKWTGLIFGSIGTVLFIAGCVWGYQRAVLYLEGAAAQGQVVEILKSSRRDGYSYRPVVEFLVGGEAKHRLIGSPGHGGPWYELGSTVKVLYDPKNPETAMIADFREFFQEPLFVGLIGLLLLAPSIVVLFLSRRASRIGSRSRKARRGFSSRA